MRGLAEGARDVSSGEGLGSPVFFVTGESKGLGAFLGRGGVDVTGDSRVLLAFVVGEGVGLPLAPGDGLAPDFAARRGIGLMGRPAFSIGECTTNAQAVLALDPSSSELLCFRRKPKRVGESDFLYVLSTKRDFGRYFGRAEPAATFLGRRTEEVLLSADV